ncbi:hypothetical protein Tco_0752586 [Tanacetum coccineum]|uniref:Uncharacterized protein n=1 Tax=Tanacetum coccineum TaxID=301880 RepID=A0ABQ4Z8A7_9ASTR
MPLSPSSSSSYLTAATFTTSSPHNHLVTTSSIAATTTLQSPLPSSSAATAAVAISTPSTSPPHPPRHHHPDSRQPPPPLATQPPIETTTSPFIFEAFGSAYKTAKGVFGSGFNSTWGAFGSRVNSPNSGVCTIAPSFPFTLTGFAKRGWTGIVLGNYNTWDSSNGFFYSTMNRQLLDSQGPIPRMRPAQALTVIQTMADHSQKWHDGTTGRNIENSSCKDGLAALVNKLDNLGRDMKKLKESVHAIQVGCQICEGPHLDKDCPLNEEVKQVEDVRYGE